MLDKLANLFTAPTPEPLDPTESRVALAALLVRVARVDHDYAEDEIATIDTVLINRYGLDQAEAAQVRGLAETLEAQAPDTVKFTRAIKDAVPYEDRQSIVEALWQVVLSDGVRDHEEDGFLRLAARLLGVNDRDSAFARQKAMRDLP